MPDQYIEVEWNGVRTRVPVADKLFSVLGGDLCVLVDFLAGVPIYDSLSKYAKPDAEPPPTKAQIKNALDWMSKAVMPAADPVFIQMWPPKTDADAEYDRDVRGGT